MKMKKKWKKILAMALVVLMINSVMDYSGFLSVSAENLSETEIQNDTDIQDDTSSVSKPDVSEAGDEKPEPEESIVEEPEAQEQGIEELSVNGENTGNWTDDLTSQPTGYEEDGNSITISSAEGLAWLSVLVNGMNGQTATKMDGKKVKLTTDIDLSGKNWIPIGERATGNRLEFWGSFDGQGHNISYMTVADKEYGGLFGLVRNGTMQNINMAHVSVKATAGAGSVIGAIGWGSSNPTVQNISVWDADISGGGEGGGGIVGCDINEGTVKNCFFQGSVSATENNYGIVYQHAIVGKKFNGTKANCYALCSSDEKNSGYGGTAVTAEQVSSGEVTWKLDTENGTVSHKNRFGQKRIEPDNDAYPRVISSSDSVVYKIAITGTVAKTIYQNKGSYQLPSYGGVTYKNSGGTVVSGEQTITADTSFTAEGTPEARNGIIEVSSTQTGETGFSVTATLKYSGNGDAFDGTVCKDAYQTMKLYEGTDATGTLLATGNVENGVSVFTFTVPFWNIGDHSIYVEYQGDEFIKKCSLAGALTLVASASVGETKYTTVQAAINDAKGGTTESEQTVKLLRDVDLGNGTDCGITVDSGTVILQTNNHMLSFCSSKELDQDDSAIIAVESGANFTLDGGNSEKASLNMMSVYGRSFSAGIKNAGNCTVKNALLSTQTERYINSSDGSIVLDQCKVKEDSKSIIINEFNSTNIQIYNCDLNGYLNTNGGNIEMNHSILRHTDNVGISFDGDGKLTMKNSSAIIGLISFNGYSVTMDLQSGIILGSCSDTTLSNSVNGSVTLPTDMTIPADTTLTIPSGAVLTIPAGATLTIPEGAKLSNSGILALLGGTLTGTGSLTGNGSFSTTGMDEDGVTVQPSYTYTGSVITIVPTVEIFGKNFTVDLTGYTVSFQKKSGSDTWNPITDVIDPGTYQVTYTKDGSTISKTFSIKETIVNEYSVTVINGAVTKGTGGTKYIEGQTVSVTTENRGGNTFTGWTSSDNVSFVDSKATTTTFVMPGKDVTVSANFSMDDHYLIDEKTADSFPEGKDKKGYATITLKKISYVYTGSEIRPVPVVSFTYTEYDDTGKQTGKAKTKKLVENVDYTLSYTNNSKVGTVLSLGKILITGMGDYKDTMTKEFTITPKSIKSAVIEPIEDVKATRTDLKAQMDAVIIVKDGVNTVSTNDYDITYQVNGDVQTALTGNEANPTLVTVSVTGKNNYKDAIKKTQTFTILPQNSTATSVSEDFTLALKAPDKSYVYSGKAIKPQITVTSAKGAKVKFNKDYKISYDHNVNAGTGTITVSGKNNYYGSKSITFTIQPKEMKKVKVKTLSKLSFRESMEDLELTITDGGRYLKKGEDYTVDFSTSKDLGLGKLKVKKITLSVNAVAGSNYTGKKEVTCSIIPRSLTNKITTKIECSNVPYTDHVAKVGATPELVIHYNSYQLRLGEDFKIVKYTSNKKVGTGKVVIQGIGNYAGKRTVKFKIIKDNKK